MSTTYILYNPKAGNHAGDVKLSLREKLGSDATLVNVTEINSREVLQTLQPDDKVILAGGDGTLNHFVNDIQGLELQQDILYYPCGSGNDFATDIELKQEDAPVKINQYLSDLPKVEVKGKTYRFINGVGYGIDGYCCEVGDQLRAASKKKINYTGIAIKGLLFHYKPTNAVVTVDGKRYEYKKVWIAPTMFGRHYGGGMIPTPKQDRAKKNILSLLIFHGSSNLRTLMIFPSIFKGEHVKHTKFVEVLEGKCISVEFDSPAPLQIDGETISDVTSYTATI